MKHDPLDELFETHTEPCAFCGAPCAVENHAFVAFCCQKHLELYQVDNDCRDFVKEIKDYTDPQIENL